MNGKWMALSDYSKMREPRRRIIRQTLQWIVAGAVIGWIGREVVSFAKDEFTQLRADRDYYRARCEEKDQANLEFVMKSNADLLRLSHKVDSLTIVAESKQIDK
jgi:hypothetical protein